MCGTRTYRAATVTVRGGTRSKSSSQGDTTQPCTEIRESKILLFSRKVDNLLTRYS